MRPPLSGLILFNYSLVGFTKLHMFKRTWEEEKDWASASICFLVEKETDNCVSFVFFSSVSPPSHYRPLPSLFAPPSTWMLKLLSVVSHTSPCQLMLALCYSIPCPPCLPYYLRHSAILIAVMAATGVIQCTQLTRTREWSIMSVASQLYVSKRNFRMGLYLPLKCTSPVLIVDKR